MTETFESLEAGHRIEGPRFAVTRETIREFCDASLDYNPLHLDDEYMKGGFGRTRFGGIIMHGMTNFGLISRTLTDWLHARGGVHRRLETRWRAPVRPGDTIQPVARITQKNTTHLSRWIVLEIEVRNQHEALIATGEAMAEFPHDFEAALDA
jgi:3-hydroxybutyryl-CoA dehydratase